jgi:hypothetical protein
MGARTDLKAYRLRVAASKGRIEAEVREFVAGELLLSPNATGYQMAHRVRDRLGISVDPAWCEELVRQ